MGSQVGGFATSVLACSSTGILREKAVALQGTGMTPKVSFFISHTMRLGRDSQTGDFATSVLGCSSTDMPPIKAAAPPEARTTRKAFSSSFRTMCQRRQDNQVGDFATSVLECSS